MAEIIAETYEIIREIGSGGGGVVYLAEHVRLQKKVILKADRRTISTRTDLLRREVDVLKELRHPYIPQVYDYFTENERVYTVMDYIEGESLDKPLKRGETFSQPQVIAWARELLEALSYLHSPTHGSPPRGYVHSDIKPANIMVRPDGQICLIDFNIALALGEENAVGRSPGYASPEHYGLDFSSDSLDTQDGRTEILPGGRGRRRTRRNRTRSGGSFSSGTGGKKTVVPDVRSDIYSLGATLYHLLSGQRPEADARQVTPLSKKEFSPQIVDIVAKAMDPNPDLRYQSAGEMLEALENLHRNDIRSRRTRRRNRVVYPAGSLLLVLGIGSAFVGLKRMQTTERWLKMAEYSRNALEDGDQGAALDYALQSLPTETGLLQPEAPAEGQRALAAAVGVYDLSDDYKVCGTVTLPSKPQFLELSPDGRTALCICSGQAVLIDTACLEQIAVLPAVDSSLSEARYLDGDTLLYAGEGGLCAYRVSSGETLWEGAMATGICLSADGKRAAAIFRDEPFATVYDTADGTVLYTVDFEGKQQTVVSDSFLNPHNDILALNGDGAWLAASFSDGSLHLYDLEQGADAVLCEADPGNCHFEGGFYGQYFACSVKGSSASTFSAYDLETGKRTGGFQSEVAFGTEVDETGVYLQRENILVRIDPVTGEQEPLVTTKEKILHFARDGNRTLATAEGSLLFFDSYANLTASYPIGYTGDLVGMAEGTALVASTESQTVRVMKYESHPEAEVFTYDPTYLHSEARISADGKTVTLFRYSDFRVYSIEGELLKEVEIPEADQVYDQQFRRDGEGSRLEVIYEDGRIRAYDAADASLLYEKEEELSDTSGYEEFVTDEYRITRELLGQPQVYRLDTGEWYCELQGEDYLTYVTQAGDCLVVQYLGRDGSYYGQLLDKDCQVLADLPCLCDVVGETLYYDFPTGNMRRSEIYGLDELLVAAREQEVS